MSSNKLKHEVTLEALNEQDEKQLEFIWKAETKSDGIAMSWYRAVIKFLGERGFELCHKELREIEKTVMRQEGGPKRYIQNLLQQIDPNGELSETDRVGLLIALAIASPLEREVALKKTLAIPDDVSLF
jgi:hypothetical protein